MSVSVRPLLISGIALAATGAVALGPAVVAAPAAHVSLPSVHVENIQLAGIGQTIYNAITPGVQYAVGGVSYLVNFIPLIGGPTAAQININYFQGIQPAVQATVNYLAGLVADPFNVIPITQAFGVTLYDIGYNWVSAQLGFFGLPALQPLPPIAASTPARTRVAAPPAAAARTSATPGESAATVTSPARAARAVRAAAAAPSGQQAVAAAGPTTQAAGASRAVARQARHDDRAVAKAAVN